MVEVPNKGQPVNSVWMCDWVGASLTLVVQGSAVPLIFKLRRRSLSVNFSTWFSYVNFKEGPKIILFCYTALGTCTICTLFLSDFTKHPCSI